MTVVAGKMGSFAWADLMFSLFVFFTRVRVLDYDLFVILRVLWCLVLSFFGDCFFSLGYILDFFSLDRGCFLVEVMRMVVGL